MQPKKFAMWLAIVSIIMLFAALTSAFFVKKADGLGESIQLPEIFLMNTIVIIMSSISMQWAYVSARNNELTTNRVMLMITVLLGLVFTYGQWTGWGELVERNIYFAGPNALYSFIYVLTGVHALHLISGIIFLLIVLQSSLKYKVHSKSLLQIQMCTTYWHFLGGLWIYLFLFLTINL